MSRRSRYRHTVPPPWRDEESQLLVGSSVLDHGDRGLTEERQNRDGARLLGLVGSFDGPLPELLNYPRPIMWDKLYWGPGDDRNDPRWPGNQQEIFSRNNSSSDDQIHLANVSLLRMNWLSDEVDEFADEEADEEQSEGEAATYVKTLGEWYSDIGEFSGEIEDIDSVLNELPDKPRMLTVNRKRFGCWNVLLLAAAALAFVFGGVGLALFIIVLWIAGWSSGVMKLKVDHVESSPDIDAYNEACEAYWADKCKRIRENSESAHQDFQQDRHEWSKIRNRRRSERRELDSAADASEFWTVAMDLVAMPNCFPRNHRSNLDSEGRVLVFDLFLPDLSSLQVVKDRELKWETKVVPANKTETRDAVSRIFFGYPLRVAYELSHTRFVEGADAIVVNSFVRRPDPRTGHERTDCIASVRCPIEDVKEIRIDKVDERASYRHFKGVFGGEPQDMVETAPLLTFSEEESRFVEGREIAEAAEGTNLAAMDWEDFEHLIRELFEKEFGSDGSEVRVTRASRDQGVDAIATDPDPLRGGKFIIQAKRWVNTVDVSAVRDLYGTVIQEGANRGILVTTSSFGRESHKFAEDKPLTLLNGDRLVQMLSKHGYDYFVDTKAARSLLHLD